MPDPIDITAVFDLPPEQAIRFLDAKGYRTSVDWTDTFDEEHDAAFTVAKIAKLDLLREIHVSLLDALAEGVPFDAWLADLRPKLKRAGWWGVVQDAQLTGTAEKVFVGPRRLRTIYDTNIRMARATALWGRVQRSKELLPFLRYSAVLDRRTRPQHRAWHGIILPVDHPWWLTHFPPCGWNCRCTVEQLNQAMIDRRGWQVAAAAPPIDLVPFRRRGSTEEVQVPRGIDPGFAYNPGIARAQAVADKAAQSLAEAAATGPADAVPLALAQILAEIPGGGRDVTTVDRLARLAIAGEVAELAAALAELLGVSS